MINDWPKDPAPRQEPPMRPEILLAEDPSGDTSLGWNIASAQALRWFRQITHKVRKGWL